MAIDNVLFYGILLLAVGFILVELYRFIRGKSSDNVIVSLLLEFLKGILNKALEAVVAELASLPVDSKEEKVKEVASRFYLLIPPTLALKVGNMSILIPARVLITEQMFQEVCWMSYRGAGNALVELRKLLEAEMAKWRAAGSPLPALVDGKYGWVEFVK